jgi:ABC-type nitrate/sulfonate/bicarbonate transport system substrate-binding protein
MEFGKIARRTFMASSAALGGATLSGGVTAWAADAPLDITIANPDGSPPRIMTEFLVRQHYLEDFGVRPKINYLPGNPQLIDALTTGKADVCLGTGTTGIIVAIANGAPLRLLAGASEKVVLGVVSVKPEVKTLKDLEGKRFGSGPKGQLVHQLVTAAMLKEGADPNKVDFVNIGNGDAIFKAVLKGEVDAGVGEASVYESQAKAGVHLLEHGALWDELPDYTNQASFASLDAIKAKKEVLTRTLAAQAKAYRFIQTPASRDAYVAARAAALGTGDPAEAVAQWGFFQRVKPWSVNLVLDPAHIRYIQELNVRMGLQKAVLPYEAVVEPSIAKAAAALLKT